MQVGLDAGDVQLFLGRHVLSPRRGARWRLCFLVLAHLLKVGRMDALVTALIRITAFRQQCIAAGLLRSLFREVCCLATFLAVTQLIGCFSRIVPSCCLVDQGQDRLLLVIVVHRH